jgi:hypothetical protein
MQQLRLLVASIRQRDAGLEKQQKPNELQECQSEPQQLQSQVPRGMIEDIIMPFATLKLEVAGGNSSRGLARPLLLYSNQRSLEGLL